MVGAAVRMPTRDREAVKRAARKPQEWQEDSWDYFDTVPEEKHLVWWVGNLLALVDLFPAIELVDGTVVAIDATDPDTITDATPAGTMYAAQINPATGVAYASPALVERAVNEWARLRPANSGQSDLQRALAMNFEVAGECSLVGRAAREAVAPDVNRRVDGKPAEPERWEIRSVSEVYEKDGKWHIRSEPGKDGEPIGDDDDVIRLYMQHPRWKLLADCNMRAVIEECRLLQVLNGQMYAEHASKAAAGGFTWPRGLSLVKAQPGPGPDEGPEPEEGDEKAEGPPMDDLVEALTWPGHDPTDVNSRVPFFVIGEKELLHPDFLRRLDFSRTTGVELDARIAARVERFAHGVAAPVEVVEGHRNTTFSNAEQIDENEFDDYLQPRVVTMCDVLSEGFLRPQILAPLPVVEGAPVLTVSPFTVAEVAEVFVWYDASPIIGSPNLSEAADSALDRFAVSRVGYRKMRRIPEEYAPDEAEQLAMFALRRGLASAEITADLLTSIDPSFVPPPPPAPLALPAGDAGDDGEAGAIVAAARQAITRQRVLAEVGAQLLGLDPATLPALMMGSPPGPPARAREGSPPPPGVTRPGDNSST